MTEKPIDLPEFPPIAGRYRRPRHYISWFGVILGLVLGIGAGLFYTWNLSPTVEYDTEPWQLDANDKAQYMVAIMLNYSYDGNLDRAINRLVELRPEGDPIQSVAEAACKLATTGYVDSSSGLRAIRSMMTFYQLQGRTGCADTLVGSEEQATRVIQIDVPTPTLAPPSTKTPTPEGPARPSPTPVRIIVPTSPPRSDYELINVSTFCDTQISGVIEVFVQDFNGEGIPGQPVRVRWDQGQDTFYTGLKPERGPAYADFQMESGKAYVIEMPGLSDPSPQPLAAVPCTTDTGATAVTSYRAVFRPVG